MGNVDSGTSIGAGSGTSAANDQQKPHHVSSSYSSLSQHLAGFQGASSLSNNNNSSNNEGEAKDIGEKQEKAADENEGTKGTEEKSTGLISKT